jgi:glycosyltransferase involved in cell wall biosynthesis
METLTFFMTSTFYPPYHIGGDAIFVKSLAEELVKIGHEVHVLHSLDAYFIKRKLRPETSDLNGVETHPIKTKLNLSSYSSYAFGKSTRVTQEFNRIIKRVNPDIVHHHNISLLGYDLLRKRNGYLNVYTAHDYWLVCQQNTLLRNGTRICDRRSCFYCSLMSRKIPQFWRRLKEFKDALKDIDVLIAPSNYVADRLSAYLGIETVTLPNFVSELPYGFEHLGFSDFFLYAGVLEPHKGILDLINCFKDVSSQIDSKLLIVGSGSLIDQIKRFVDKYKLSDKIVLLGQISNNGLHQLLRNAKALIVPSIWHENCPLIALETLSVGTPVIAASKGGLPELLKRVNIDLVYASHSELKKILVHFENNNLSLNQINALYQRHYSPRAYLKKYLALVDDSEFHCH